MLGRFLSVDPLNPQTLNGYAYGNNSPVTFADPTGLATTECDGTCDTNNGNGRIAVPDGTGGTKITGPAPSGTRPPANDPPAGRGTRETIGSQTGPSERDDPATLDQLAQAHYQVPYSWLQPSQQTMVMESTWCCPSIRWRARGSIASDM